MEKVIIIGATSGIGWNVADILNKKGYSIGIAGRRCERLENFKAERGGVIETAVIDVTKEDASANMLGLAERMGGVDTIILCSGIGCQNVGLEMSAEIAITNTNVVGFTRMIDTAFNYFKENGGGHIAAVRTWRCSCIFCNKAFPKHVYPVPCPIVINGWSKGYFY